MKLYITRHGQVCPKEFFGSVDYPTGDIPLSKLGQKQAVCLGNELKKIGFKGKIISSPYRRTMMTANLAATQCGASVYTDGELREMFFSDEAARDFVGMTLDDIKKTFPKVAHDAELAYPWWTKTLDTKKMVVERLEKFWDKVIKTDIDEVLAVGHGASVYGTIYYFNKKFKLGLTDDLEELADYLAEKGLNCGISCVETDKDGKLLSANLFYTEHLPDELLTSNANHKSRPEIIKK